MGHDQIFKEFLRAFLKDFLELFFPKVEARLDFGDLRFLDTESFTSFPEGSSRAADIVAEVRRRNRARKILLVHVEVQAERRRTFRKRMFEYFTLLWMRHRVSIFPLAVYLRGGRSSLDEERFVIRLFGREQLVFRFPVVALARFDAREYVEKDSPVAAALASLMSRRGDRAPLNLRVSMMERVEQKRARRGSEISSADSHRDVLRAGGRRAAEVRASAVAGTVSGGEKDATHVGGQDEGGRP